MNNKTFSLIGAGVGIAAFISIALLPAILYGGYAGLLLARGVFGVPVQPTLLVRMFVISGMILGTLAIGSLFTVIGAIAGTAFGSLTKYSHTGIAQTVEVKK